MTPCPFCRGKRFTISVRRDRRLIAKMFYVHCDDCNYQTGEHEDIERVKKFWCDAHDYGVEREFEPTVHNLTIDGDDRFGVVGNDVVCLKN